MKFLLHIYQFSSETIREFFLYFPFYFTDYLLFIIIKAEGVITTKITVIVDTDMYTVYL